MISLAGRDILHSWGKFVFTGIGLGLLIGVTAIDVAAQDTWRGEQRRQNLKQPRAR